MMLHPDLQSLEGRMWISLMYLVPASVAAGVVTHSILPKFGPMFIKAGLFGVDMSKKKDPGREPIKVQR